MQFEAKYICFSNQLQRFIAKVRQQMKLSAHKQLLQPSQKLTYQGQSHKGISWTVQLGVPTGSQFSLSH